MTPPVLPPPSEEIGIGITRTEDRTTLQFTRPLDSLTLPNTHMVELGQRIIKQAKGKDLAVPPQTGRKQGRRMER